MSSEKGTQVLAHRFGEVAQSLGFLNDQQIEEAVRRQQGLRATGSKCRIGELLSSQGVLTASQVKQILSEQRKRRTAAAQKALPMEYFGDYKLIERLGEGGMGTVFKARETLAERVVALKVLRQSYAGNTNFVTRFNREARLAGALSHPNIVTCHNAGTCHGVQFLAMEYVEGETLKDRIKREGKLPEAEALRIAREVALGLAHAHSKGVLHRDIKPDNILLGKDGSIKISDFGTAKSFLDEENLTMAGVVIGTPFYISPEQAKASKDIDQRADLYSLGATLYLALTGKVPFESPNPVLVMRCHLYDEPKNPKELCPELSTGAVQLVTKLLAKKPEARYQGGAELAEAIDRVLAGKAPDEGVQAPRKTLVRRKRPQLRLAAAKRLRMAGCLSVLVLVVGAAIAWAALCGFL
ncbi:MAG: serine/threonine-protein kinase [Planctomycetota bacterium]